MQLGWTINDQINSSWTVQSFDENIRHGEYAIDGNHDSCGSVIETLRESKILAGNEFFYLERKLQRESRSERSMNEKSSCVVEWAKKKLFSRSGF